MKQTFGRAFPPGTETQRKKQLDCHSTIDQGHGRTEYRTLEASSRLAGNYDWPSIGQVCRVTRRVKVGNESTTDIAYLVTSLPPQQASAKQLLELNRGHWAIENRLHWVRDVTFGEDKSQARSGPIPQNVAAMRNAAISAIRFAGLKGIAPNLRHFNSKPWDILKMLRSLIF